MKGLLFTYLLTYGGAIASLVNPWHGLLVYVSFAILRPEALWHWSIPRGNYSRIVAIAFLAGWALHGFGNWNFRRAKLVVWSLIGFWAWLLLHLAAAPNYEAAVAAVESLSKTYLPFVAGITLITSVERLKALAWVIVVSQGYLALEFNQTYYHFSGFNPEEWTFAGLDNNGIAISMCTTIGMAFFLGMHAPKWWQKLVAFGSAALMSHVVLFSMSRGGMLALLVTGAVTFVIIPKQPKHYAMLLLGLALVLRLAGPAVQREFATAFADEEHRDASSTKRIDHWIACTQSMASNPLGVGIDRWGETAPQYGLPVGMEAHNTWMQLGAELGIPGLGLILTFYLGCLARLWPLLRSQSRSLDPELPTFARMVIASLAGFMISASFVTVEGLEVSYYVNLVGAGALTLAPHSCVPLRREA